MFIFILKILFFTFIIIYIPFMLYFYVLLLQLHYLFILLFLCLFCFSKMNRQENGGICSSTTRTQYRTYLLIKKGRFKMKAYTLGLYEKALPGRMSWKEKLTCAGQCGYDFVEISIDETEEKLARLDWSTEERLDLVKMMKETGVPIRSMCLSGHRKYPFGASNPEVRRRSMDIMEKAICLADDLGIRIIQLAGYDVYYEPGTAETEHMFRKNLKKAVLMAAAKGIHMGFETMETDFMNTTEKAMKYVTLIDNPYLGVYPDSGNLTNAALLAGTGVAEDLETGRGHIFALHLKETVPGKFREIPFLTGHVDFETIIAKAWELGVRRYVTEMWDVGNAKWMEDIQFARRSMSSILDQQF